MKTSETHHKKRQTTTYANISEKNIIPILSTGKTWGIKITSLKFHRNNFLTFRLLLSVFLSNFKR